MAIVKIYLRATREIKIVPDSESPEELNKKGDELVKKLNAEFSNPMDVFLDQKSIQRAHERKDVYAFLISYKPEHGQIVMEKLVRNASELGLKNFGFFLKRRIHLNTKV